MADVGKANAVINHLGLVVEIGNQEYLFFGNQAGTIVAHETGLYDLLLSHLIQIELKIPPSLRF